MPTISRFLFQCFCFTWCSFDGFRTLAKRCSFNNDRKMKNLLFPLTISLSLILAHFKWLVKNAKKMNESEENGKQNKKNALTHNPWFDETWYDAFSHAQPEKEWRVIYVLSVGKCVSVSKWHDNQLHVAMNSFVSQDEKKIDEKRMKHCTMEKSLGDVYKNESTPFRCVTFWLWLLCCAPAPFWYAKRVEKWVELMLSHSIIFQAYMHQIHTWMTSTEMKYHFSTFNSPFFKHARFELSSFACMPISLATSRSRLSVSLARMFVKVRWSAFDAFVSPHLCHPNIILTVLETMRIFFNPRAHTQPDPNRFRPSSDDFYFAFSHSFTLSTSQFLSLRHCLLVLFASFRFRANCVCW